MKIWCDKCKGSGVEHYSTFGKKYCSRCNGKGFVEIEGTVEDLELAQATKLAFVYSHVPFTNIKELRNWYRKSAHNDTRTENAATPEKCECDT